MSKKKKKITITHSSVRSRAKGEAIFVACLIQVVRSLLKNQGGTASNRAFSEVSFKLLSLQFHTELQFLQSKAFEKNFFSNSPGKRLQNIKGYTTEQKSPASCTVQLE